MEGIKRPGRPRKKDSRTEHIKVRLNDAELGMLLSITDRTGDNYSEIMRKALTMYYRICKK